MAVSTRTKKAGVYDIDLVDKVIRVLEALRDAPEGVTLQELSTRTGYVKSSVHRILASLKSRGYAEQQFPGGPYSLGLQCLLLARGFKGGIELLPHARPYLREIVDAFDESAYLAIVRDGRGVFVEVVEPRRRDLRLVGPLGAEVHYHATAAGKIIAASLSASARSALLARIELTPLTPHTMTRRAEVEKDWTETARRGYAVNDEETIVGAIFMAAPVTDADGSICGCISVGMPKARYTAQLGRTLSPRLVEICQRLSNSLKAVGYQHSDRRPQDQR